MLPLDSCRQAIVRRFRRTRRFRLPAKYACAGAPSGRRIIAAICHSGACYELPPDQLYVSHPDFDPFGIGYFRVRAGYQVARPRPRHTTPNPPTTSRPTMTPNMSAPDTTFGREHLLAARWCWTMAHTSPSRRRFRPSAADASDRDPHRFTRRLQFRIWRPHSAVAGGHQRGRRRFDLEPGQPGPGQPAGLAQTANFWRSFPGSLHNPSI